MDREALVDRVIEVLELTTSYDPKAGATRKLPIIWISGGSGVGKSALLLQSVKRFVVEHQTPVNYLMHFPDRIPESLMYWSRQGIPSLIVVDDLYAPNYRDSALWSTVSRLAYEAPYVTILTCGPDDYRGAFEQYIQTQGAISVIPVEVPALSDIERDSYCEWYRLRTQQQEVEPIKESNFVVAAFLLELKRRGEADISEFTARLWQRLNSYGLADEFLTSLAVNQLGIEAPIKLFQSKRDALNQLIKEGLVQLVELPNEESYVLWFHPALARVIYDILLPPSNIETRAIHLARYFLESYDDWNRAVSLLELLRSKKQNRIPRDLVKESLNKIGGILKQRNPPDLNIGYLFNYREAALKNGLLFEKDFPPRLLRKWMVSTDVTPDEWALLWQILWDYSSQEERDGLIDATKSWLTAHMDLAGWNYVWRKLWEYKTKDELLIDLARQWLAQHSDGTGWNFVFRKVYEAGVREDWLVQNGIDGLLNSPVLTAADKYLWSYVESLNPAPSVFLSTLTRRLSNTRIPHLISIGTNQIIARISQVGINPFIEGLDQNMNGPGWPYLFQSVFNLIEKNLSRDYEYKLVSLAREWLIGREETAEWSFIWQRLLEARPGDSTLLEQGREWVSRREDSPDWSFVWERLLRHSPNDFLLLHQGREWLVGREGRRDWSFVWERLLALNPGDSSLLQQGREWLNEHKNARDWAFVWERLLEVCPGDSSLLEQGREWLVGRKNRQEWTHIWERLLKACPDDNSLLEQGCEWLVGREDRRDWTFVWERLLEVFSDDDWLQQLGRDWLVGREDRRDWIFVWQRLLELNPSDNWFLEQGYGWLIGREDKQEWVRIWRRLFEMCPDDDWLQQQGLKWLAGHEDKQEWPHIWQRLLEVRPGDNTLLEQGRGWLAGREDKQEWSHVWERLLHYSPHDALLVKQGREWLSGREGRRDWSHIWERLLEVCPDDNSLLQQGWEWLVGQKNERDWAFVWQRLLALNPRDNSLLEQGREWLAGREDMQEWSHVWERLLEVCPGDSSLLEQGREWLVGREDRPDYPFVKRRLGW